MLKSQMFYNSVVFKAWASISHGVSADAFPPMMFHSGECAPVQHSDNMLQPRTARRNGGRQHVATQDSASGGRAPAPAACRKPMNGAPLMCVPCNQ
jgi:hypothetical protein